jgi:hypothetical protein
MEGNRIACKVLVGKPEGKRSLESSRRRWVDNIKIYLIMGRVVWSGLIWLRTRITRGLL